MLKVQVVPAKTRRWPGYVAAVFLLAFAVRYPVTAAHVALHAVSLASAGARGLSAFAASLHLN